MSISYKTPTPTTITPWHDYKLCVSCEGARYVKDKVCYRCNGMGFVVQKAAAIRLFKLLGVETCEK